MNTTQYSKPAETHPLVERYVRYLRKDRGLAENSILVYTPFIRDLLADQVAKTGGVAIEAFDATTIRRFLLGHIRGRSADITAVQISG